MSTNGTHPTSPSIFRDPSDSPDQQYVPDSWAPMLADLRWLNEQYNLGAFDEFPGEYIAVSGKALLGHGLDPHELRRRVSAETGIPANDIVTEFISRNWLPPGGPT